MAVVPAGEWFDLWHAHPNDGDAADRWANLLSVWARVDEAGRPSGRPWQSWLVIEPGEPRADAVYLHTPNPNRDNFPYLFEGVAWGAEVLAWAAPGAGLEFDRSDYGGVELLWVRRLQDAESGDAADAARRAGPGR